MLVSTNRSQAPPTQVRKQLIITAEMDDQINDLAIQAGTSVSEIVRKALTLYITAAEKRRQGFKMGFARQDQALETEIIGL